MRVLTWNVFKRLPLLWPEFAAMRADIAALQETTIVPEDERFPHRIVDVGQQNAIVSRFPLTRIKDPPFCIAGIAHARAGDVTVVSIWSKQSKGSTRYNSSNRQAIEWIAEHVEGPSIFMGDFNASSAFDHRNRKPPHTANAARLRELGFVSAFHELYGFASGDEPKRYATFVRKQRNKVQAYMIDYVFVRGLGLDRVAVKERWKSDHHPVVVDLVSNVPPLTARPSRNG